MIVTLALRSFQIIFSIIVLGLSISLLRGQLKDGSYQEDNGNIDQISNGTPPQTGYAAFCGGWGILIALVGFGGIFVESLQGIILAGLDALTAVITLAGGIAFAVNLKGGSCSDDNFTTSNSIIRGAGTFSFDGVTLPAFNEFADLSSRCHMAQAVMVFLFLAFLAFVGSAATGLMGKGRRGGSSYV